MKARTQRQKRQAKRGRPRIENVEREPNGRAQRLLKGESAKVVA